MPSWWGKSSSKEVKKKKANKESFIDTLQRKFKTSTEEKGNIKPGGSRRHIIDIVSEKGCLSRVESRSSSPSTNVSRCQSFAERGLAQPLPLPGVHPSSIGRTDSGISVKRPLLEKRSKPLLYLPLPRPACISNRGDTTDDADLATASVYSDSIDSDDPADSRHLSPRTVEFENGSKTVVHSPSSTLPKDQSPAAIRKNSRELPRHVNPLFNNQSLTTLPRRGPLSGYAPTLQIP